MTNEHLKPPNVPVRNGKSIHVKGGKEKKMVKDMNASRTK